MTHEHLLSDFSGVQKVPTEASRKAKYYAPVTIDLLGSLNYDALPNLDNLRLLDVETAISEALLYKRAGGDTIVEATSRGIDRDPAGLREIARATGLNIVMNAILQRDYPLILGVFVIISLCVVAANAIADVVYSVVDPRIAL